MNNQNNNMNTYNADINSTRAVDTIQNTQLEQNPYINQQTNVDQNLNPISTSTTQTQSIFTNGDFVKGALIGAAVTFLLTNKTAQETIFKAASKGSELFQAGMEELKERYEDAKAQMESK